MLKFGAINTRLAKNIDPEYIQKKQEKTGKQCQWKRRIIIMI
jgi:hypothetical protein